MSQYFYAIRSSCPLNVITGFTRGVIISWDQWEAGAAWCSPCSISLAFGGFFAGVCSPVSLELLPQPHRGWDCSQFWQGGCRDHSQPLQWHQQGLKMPFSSPCAEDRGQGPPGWAFPPLPPLVTSLKSPTHTGVPMGLCRFGHFLPNFPPLLPAHTL